VEAFRRRRQPGGPSNVDFGGFDFSDLFEGARAGGRKTSSGSGGGFKDIFSSIFTGGGEANRRRRPEPGSDLEYQVNVPFWTAIRGGVMKLNIARRDVCGNCMATASSRLRAVCDVSWSGNDRADGRPDEVQRHLSAVPWDGKNLSACAVCHGEGSVERTDPLEIRIKAGTRDGQRIRIAGKGNAGLRGGGWAIFT